jgi:hypothetical protein
MTVLRPIYHSLATGRHINEVVIGLLLIAVIFDGYAIIAATLAICHWVKRSIRKNGHLPQLPHLKNPHSPAPSANEIHAEAIRS